MNPKIDLNPKEVERLPLGVHPCREYRIFNHERAQWIGYREFLYETAHGTAQIVLAPGRSLQQGITAANRLLKTASASAILEPGVYGTVNSVRNHEILSSGSPLALIVARSGAHTEPPADGQSRAWGLHHSVANRPALQFRSCTERSQSLIQSGHIFPEAKQMHAAPVGCHEELFLAGKIANRWSDEFYQSVMSNMNYHLWITNDEKNALCLSLLPLLLGLKMDVIAVPGMSSRRQKPEKDVERLPSELNAYRFQSPDGARRLVGIAFDQEHWRNPKPAEALLRLCHALRESGALVFVTVIPAGHSQDGIAAFFAKHCVHGNALDFTPILDLLNGAFHLDRDYEISHPTPDISCFLKTLAEQAQAFSVVQQTFKNRGFAELPAGVVNQVVLEIGLLTADRTSADSCLEQFRARSLEAQASQWADWMAHNPFQAKLDRELEAYVPPVFRDSGSSTSRFCFEGAANNRRLPEG